MAEKNPDNIDNTILANEGLITLQRVIWVLHTRTTRQSEELNVQCMTTRCHEPTCFERVIYDLNFA